MKTLRPLLFAIALISLLSGYHAATAQERGDDAAAEGSAEDDGGDDGTGGSAPPDDGSRVDATGNQGQGIDVDGLRQEYLKLRDRLFRSRARAAAVASELYSTRATIYLDYKSSRFYSIDRATIRLDGASVFDSSDGAIAKDKAPRFQGFVAPGRHVVTIRIEATGKDDDRFTTAVEHSFVVQAVAGKDLEIEASARDEGNIPFNWKKKEKGSYKLGLDVSVEARKPSQSRGKSDGRIRRR